MFLTDTVKIRLIVFQSRDVQQKLLDIFTDQYTSFSVKLQIVQALDQSTRLSCGMEWLLGKHSLQADSQKVSCYQRILNIMQTKQVYVQINAWFYS